MIHYLPISEFNDLNLIKDLWNEENGKIYPISEKLFKGSVLDNKELSKDNSFLAILDDEVVGFILTKVWNEKEDIPVYQNFGWISLFYVKHKLRRQGIGSQLLKLAEEGFVKIGKKRIVLGADTYNFFPGLPVDFVNHTSWFTKRGFTVTNEDHDMIRDFDHVSELLEEPELPYEVRFATLDDKEAMLDFFQRCFKGRWDYEAKQYFAKGGTGREFVIALDGTKVIAFCRANDQKSPEVLHNINWSDRFENHGGVGPLGVDPEYRKKNLGYAVTAHAINGIQKRGCKTCIIDWTGLVNFYKLFGFEVWKTYYKMGKDI